MKNIYTEEIDFLANIYHPSIQNGLYKNQPKDHLDDIEPRRENMKENLLYGGLFEYPVIVVDWKLDSDSNIMINEYEDNISKEETHYILPLEKLNEFLKKKQYKKLAYLKTFF